jgi:hypothetical protein
MVDGDAIIVLAAGAFGACLLARGLADIIARRNSPQAAAQLADLETRALKIIGRLFERGRK